MSETGRNDTACALIMFKFSASNVADESARSCSESLEVKRVSRPTEELQQVLEVLHESVFKMEVKSG